MMMMMFDNDDVEDDNDDNAFPILRDGYNFSLHLVLFQNKYIVKII